MNKFSVGTLVKLKDYLEINAVYDYLTLYEHMYHEFKNKIARIRRVEECEGHIYYEVDGLFYTWSEPMLEKVKDKRTSIYV